MSRARMLHASLFHNPEFRAMTDTAFKLAIVAMLPETDDWGRGYTAALTAVGGLTPEQVPAAVRAISATGIVKFYGVDNRYYYFPKFFRYQGIKRPRSTTIPAPLDPEYSAECDAKVDSLRRNRDASRVRMMTMREGERHAPPEIDGDDILAPAPPVPVVTPPTSGDPASRRCGAAPIDLPPRLRPAYDEIVQSHGIAIAARALKAAKRWFPMPSEKQLAQVLQAAVEEGLLESDAELWPDFRDRIDGERAREINPAGAAGSKADAAIYARIGKRVQA